jgi:alkanesulfonate monooxygenase SsuD/methylene tetrahydromethanopterin reductase-like flavin-dependent oxidoreductase (luciferase family)
MGQIAEYGSHVPDEAMREFFVVGSPDECIEKVDEFRKAGVRHFIFEFMSLDHVRMAKDFKTQVISHFIE